MAKAHVWFGTKLTPLLDLKKKCKKILCNNFRYIYILNRTQIFFSWTNFETIFVCEKRTKKNFTALSTLKWTHLYSILFDKKNQKLFQTGPQVYDLKNSNCLVPFLAKFSGFRWKSSIFFWPFWKSAVLLKVVENAEVASKKFENAKNVERWGRRGDCSQCSPSQPYFFQQKVQVFGKLLD